MLRSMIAGLAVCSALSLPSHAWAWGHSGYAYPPFSQTFVPLNTFYTPYPFPTTNMQWTPRPTGMGYGYAPATTHLSSPIYSYAPPASSTPLPMGYSLMVNPPGMSIQSELPSVSQLPRQSTPAFLYFQPSTPGLTTIHADQAPYHTPSETWYWR
jgi:hypothetical protein